MRWNPVGPAPIVSAVTVTMSAVCLMGIIYLLIRQFARSKHLGLQSLPLYDLWVLAGASEDRTGVIQEFHDWQHRLLLAVKDRDHDVRASVEAAGNSSRSA